MPNYFTGLLIMERGRNPRKSVFLSLNERNIGASFAVEDALACVFFEVVCFFLDRVATEREDRIFDGTTVQVVCSDLPVLVRVVVLMGQKLRDFQ